MPCVFVCACLRVCLCVFQCILEQDVFHRSLLVCCLEIVIFSYRPPGDFPNLITIFQLPAYHFYKVVPPTTTHTHTYMWRTPSECVEGADLSVCVCLQVIEVLVRSEQGLFREVVKHLNQVEEQVLESLAWSSDSPLWESLQGTKEQVPACQQVRSSAHTCTDTAQHNTPEHLDRCVSMSPRIAQNLTITLKNW